MAPNFGAGIVDNPPIKLPIGVLTAETITTSFMFLNLDETKLLNSKATQVISSQLLVISLLFSIFEEPNTIFFWIIFTNSNRSFSNIYSM